ncbi:uncharacterized protein EV422DRAFT_509348 [Fimicolochytrium jonesii]|uniref:uncharacterized protein n=1 Tax=Fimicolochytrium jonesii TaxID=1396493 RepID=UPI0022FDDDC6|nr:uncharacterized protein EV422DRAFT_509348 [Fimicolochytrium jonesii]KAI8816919.1 hypothetical protein EV422DRAFT_509348 [Fimicolochytrium jonesii]
MPSHVALEYVSGIWVQTLGRANFETQHHLPSPLRTVPTDAQHLLSVENRWGRLLYRLRQELLNYVDDIDSSQLISTACCLYRTQSARGLGDGQRLLSGKVPRGLQAEVVGSPRSRTRRSVALRIWEIPTDARREGQETCLWSGSMAKRSLTPLRDLAPARLALSVADLPVTYSQRPPSMKTERESTGSRRSRKEVERSLRTAQRSHASTTANCFHATPTYNTIINASPATPTLPTYRGPYTDEAKSPKIMPTDSPLLPAPQPQPVCMSTTQHPLTAFCDKTLDRLGLPRYVGLPPRADAPAHTSVPHCLAVCLWRGVEGAIAARVKESSFVGRILVSAVLELEAELRRLRRVSAPVDQGENCAPGAAVQGNAVQPARALKSKGSDIPIDLKAGTRKKTGKKRKYQAAIPGLELFMTHRTEGGGAGQEPALSRQASNARNIWTVFAVADCVVGCCNPSVIGCVGPKGHSLCVAARPYRDPTWRILEFQPRPDLKTTTVPVHPAQPELLLTADLSELHVDEELEGESTDRDEGSEAQHANETSWAISRGDAVSFGSGLLVQIGGWASLTPSFSAVHPTMSPTHLRRKDREPVVPLQRESLSHWDYLSERRSVLPILARRVSEMSSPGLRVHSENFQSLQVLKGKVIPTTTSPKRQVNASRGAQLSRNPFERHPLPMVRRKLLGANYFTSGYWLSSFYSPDIDLGNVLHDNGIASDN